VPVSTGRNRRREGQRLETREERQRRPVSRVLFPERVAQGDSHFSRAPVARRLQRPNPGAARATPSLPYLALLRVGFAEPARSPAPLVSSYLTVSPLPPSRTAVCFLWHWSVGFPPLAVSQHPALWSPDFPPAALPRPATVQPSLAHPRVYRAGDRRTRATAQPGAGPRGRTGGTRRGRAAGAAPGMAPGPCDGRSRGRRRASPPHRPGAGSR